MCLEDRFLLALYKNGGSFKLTDIADNISITENAVLSIIHRIEVTYPEYLVIQNNGSGQLVAANNEKEKEVRNFLSGGGFTAINEQEFREYYKKELDQYTKLQNLKNTIKQHAWIKWAAGLGFSLGSGFALFKFLHAQKK